MRLAPQSVLRHKIKSTPSSQRLAHPATCLLARRLSSRANHVETASAKLREKEVEREFFLSVLGASATKRDAKAYLSRFKTAPGQKQLPTDRPKHIALIKIRALQDLDDDVVDGLAQTISQLNRLGLGCAVVLESDIKPSLEDHFIAVRGRSFMTFQADRLVRSLERLPSTRACRSDDILGFSPAREGVQSTVQVKGAVEVQHDRLLARAMERGVIPVVIPIAFTEESQQVVSVSADDVVLCLTRYFAGLKTPYQQQLNDAMLNEDKTETTGHVQERFQVDRIIVLDPFGALFSWNRAGNKHAFINLEQEYEDIRREVSDMSESADPYQTDGHTLATNEIVRPQSLNPNVLEITSIPATSTSDRHVKNLDLLRNALFLLPPSSSALLTTPLAAATLPAKLADDSTPGVGTRRPKNPLIFNLLTDKPLKSSSLPASRISPDLTDSPHESDTSNIATFAKRGMQLTMIPDPRMKIWRAPAAGEKHMSLQDPDIDFPRLLNLIEDSFNRPLDVDDYLNRIRDKIAGVIVAGEYEGGAILTWELPPGVPGDGSEASRQKMVPYLDKFAVLKRSQGAGGVADIVFSAMVRSCFPDGVCWRSRKNNPVNKWYFERSAGTWKIRDTDWTMFWTDRDLALDGERFLDYESVCRTVRPSWADNKAVVD